MQYLIKVLMGYLNIFSPDIYTNCILQSSINLSQCKNITSLMNMHCLNNKHTHVQPHPGLINYLVNKLSIWFIIIKIDCIHCMTYMYIYTLLHADTRNITVWKSYIILSNWYSLFNWHNLKISLISCIQYLGNFTDFI